MKFIILSLIFFSELHTTLVRRIEIIITLLITKHIKK